MSLIKIENCSYKYKKQMAIDNISIDIERGDFTAVIGNNGSGKTTLTKLIAKVIEPVSGKVFYDNNCDYTVSDIGKKIGYLFQNPDRQIFATTVLDEMTFMLRFNGVDEKIIRQGVEAVATQFAISHLLDRKCYALSQGEKQRLALATMFMEEKEFLILDEPTSSLDFVRKNELSLILDEIQKKGVGILLISHDMDFVNRHANRIITLEKGVVIHDARV